MLIESTRELLWERGYVGTSPKAIQRRSGAGQGSMYHHFDGKRGLAHAAIERNAADLVSRADADLGGPGGVTERVARYMRRERAALRGCPVGRLTMDPEVMADDELRRPVERAFAAVRERLAAVIDEGRQNGELVQSVDLPVNVLALPGVPPVSELAQLGVKRISVGGAFAFAALGALAEAGRELLDHGSYGYWELARPGSAKARAAFSS